MLAAWLLGDRKKQALRNSLDTLGTSLVLFVVFGAFFGAFTNLGPYWPVLLIVAGVLVGARALITGRNDAIIRE
jgi:hypothetical protein